MNEEGTVTGTGSTLLTLNITTPSPSLHVDNNNRRGFLICAKTRNTKHGPPRASACSSSNGYVAAFIRESIVNYVVHTYVRNWHARSTHSSARSQLRRGRLPRVTHVTIGIRRYSTGMLCRVVSSPSSPNGGIFERSFPAHKIDLNWD